MHKPAQRRPDADQAATEQAILRVLEAEREADAAVQQCLAQAKQWLEQARQRARQIEQRAELRTASVQHRARQRLASERARLERETLRYSDRTPPGGEDLARVDAVVRRLAVELTGAQP
jgi:vacuolar-type H+-ATPase subunit H